MDKKAKREVENIVRAELAKVTTVSYTADRRTEELFNIYANLGEASPWRKKIDEAVAKIDEGNYPLLLQMRYTKHATVEDLAGFYGRSVWSIYAELRRQRHEVAKQLFAEEMAEELVNMGGDNCTAKVEAQ